jgi:hypothetical protein
VNDTNRYVDTVTPLASDPAVQQAITTNLTNTVFQYIDVSGITEEAFAALAERGSLPPELATRLQALVVPVANGVRSFAENQISRVVESDAFARAWVEANRTAHEQLVAALTGEESSSVQIEGDAVTVNLAAFVTVVKDRLVSSGFQLAERIPAVNAQFTIFQSADVQKVQRGYSLLNTLGYWLPIICLVLAGLGVYLARNHRLAFIGVGLGVALAMLAVGAALAVGRRLYLDGVPSDVLPPDAAAVLYDTLVRYLREALRALLVLGLVVAAAAFLTGPSVTATAIRRWIVSGFAALRGGLSGLGVELAGVTAWVAPRARILRAAVVVVAFVILLMQQYRTPELVGWLTVGVLAALAIIQFLATPPRRATPKPPLAEPGPTAQPVPA